MILGIGIDLVEVGRFKAWSTACRDRLHRVYSDTELDYCWNEEEQKFNEQQLASRFAAKEAFFKAFSAALVKLDKTQTEVPFLIICKYSVVIKGKWDVPQLAIDWRSIEKYISQSIPMIQIELSISHEQQYAVAQVVLNSK